MHKKRTALLILALFLVLVSSGLSPLPGSGIRRAVTTGASCPPYVPPYQPPCAPPALSDCWPCEEPAFFELTDLQITPERPTLGTEATISCTITNTGGEKGSQNIDLYIEQSREATRLLTLAAGEGDALSFSYAFQHSGGHTLKISSEDDSETASVTVLLPARLEVSVERKDFGKVEVGSSASQSFTITNRGEAELEGHIQCSSGDCEAFSFSPSSFSLGKQGTSRITVRFSPSQAKEYLAVIGIESNGGNASVRLIGEGEPHIERTLRVAFPWPISADPAVGPDYSGSAALVNLYDSLVYPTLEGDVKPRIAEWWEPSPDGLTWTFYLKQGVWFHDLSELTAEDVKFSMDRLLSIGGGYAHLFRDLVESTEVIDDYTVRFHLARSFGPLPTNLVRLYILNKDCVMANLEDGSYDGYGDYGETFLLTHDAGSGAYTIKEFALEEDMQMERFPGYWGEIDPQAPDLVTFIATPEAMTVRTMMANQELEISDQWKTEVDFAALDAIEGVDIAKFSTGEVFFYMMHTKKPPTDDIHFRKAMAYAFDYEATAWLFDSPVSHGPVAAGFPGWNPNVFTYTYDLEKAIEYLHQSKYYDQLDDYPVEIHWVHGVPSEEKLALLFQANMAEIGIKVNVVSTPWPLLVDKMADIETSPNIVTIFVTPHYPEAGSMLESRYHSNSAPTWQQNEWLLDSFFDETIEDAIATVDREERFAKYRELQDYLVELCPSLFVFDQVEKHAYQTYIDWPAARGEVIQVMGYNMDVRFIKVLPH